MSFRLGFRGRTADPSSFATQTNIHNLSDRVKKSQTSTSDWHESQHAWREAPQQTRPMIDLNVFNQPASVNDSQANNWQSQEANRNWTNSHDLSPLDTRDFSTANDTKSVIVQEPKKVHKTLFYLPPCENQQNILRFPLLSGSTLENIVIYAPEASLATPLLLEGVNDTTEEPIFQANITDPISSTHIGFVATKATPIRIYRTVNNEVRPAENNEQEYNDGISSQLVNVVSIEANLVC